MSLSWSAGGSLPTFNGGKVAYGQVGADHVFISAVPYGGVARSTDFGATWSAVTPGGDTWNDVAFGAGLFVLVSNNGDSSAYTSPDGVTWTPRTLPGTGISYDCIVFGGGQFVAFPRNQTFVATSPDGITWTQRTGAVSAAWAAAAYGNGIFGAVAGRGVANTTITQYSTDGGLTWTAGALPAAKEWGGLAYGAGGFLATHVLSSDDAYATSPDFVSWTARSFPAAFGYRIGVAATDAGAYIVMDSFAQRALLSEDGIAWTPYATIANAQWDRPGVGGGYVVAVATDAGSSERSTLPVDLDEDVDDGIVAASTTETEILTPVSDTFDALATVQPELVAWLASVLQASGVVGTSVSWIASVSELVRTLDVIRLVFEEGISDSIQHVSDMTGTPSATLAAVDAMQLSGAVSNSVAALAALSDSLALQELVRMVQEGEISDTAALVEALESLVSAMEHLVSTALLGDEGLGLAVVTVLVPETVDVTTDAAASVAWLAAVEEGVDLAVGFSFDGVPYYAMAMNTTTRGVTEYTNFSFNSVAAFNNTLYGAGDAGLYRLEGEDDAGAQIPAYLRTALQRVANGQAAGVSDAYLGFRGDGRLQLKVVVSDPTTRTRKGYVYDLIHTAGSAPLPGRFKIGKGLRSVYMAFELGNVAGSDFAVDVMEVHPLVTYRRLT